MNERLKKLIEIELRRLDVARKFLKQYSRKFFYAHNKHEGVTMLEHSVAMTKSLKNIQEIIDSSPKLIMAEPGPWRYKYESSTGKHFVESIGPSGEDYDDVRLYINGNMLDEDYETYGQRLADQLNGRLSG